jgi:hypothetical protein
MNERECLREALDQLAEHPARGRTAVEKLFAELRDARKSLLTRLEEKTQEVELLRKENAELLGGRHDDKVLVEQLRQQLASKEFALAHPPKPPATPRRYDVDMVRDFLEHLLWAVRVRHFESTNKPGNLNPELLETLGKFVAKYPGSPWLLVSDFFADDPSLPDSQKRHIRELFQAARASEAEEWLRHLEGLEPILQEACRVVMTNPGGGKEPHRIWHFRDLMKTLQQGEQDDKDGQ